MKKITNNEKKKNGIRKKLPLNNITVRNTSKKQLTIPSCLVHDAVQYKNVNS